MDKSQTIGDFYVARWSLHFILEREEVTERLQAQEIKKLLTDPFDKSVEEVRWGEARLELMRSVRGYCDGSGERRQECEL